jgi:hypothetical protein
MSFDSLLEVLKFAFSGGITALVLGYFYHQVKISQERDRLLEEKRINEIREQEEEITKKINNSSRDDLLKSAAEIASRLGKQ